jgi:uroporphyrinogen III methyltransferase/synthase
MDLRLLELMPKNAEKVHVGKRCGQHTKAQDEITRLICEHARRGRKVVRLKGGDPGIFGRLTEEVDALETLGIPFHVIPGISALQVATTGTGMLLTRRGVSRGFCALTSRRSGGITASINSVARAALPVVFFMAIESISKVVEELISDGTASGTPAAVVFDAGGDDELLVKASLGDISSAVAKIETSLPGLLIVGEITQFGFARTDGALAGRRILLTCSAALQRRAVDMVRDFGGHPLCCPLIRITPNLQALEDISDISSNDWIVITSPSAVRCLMEMLKADIRRIPRIMVCGAGTARELKRYGVFPDAMPESGYGAESIFETAKKLLIYGDRVLRLRSDKAGAWLAEKMRALGAEVNDCTLYKNEPVICEKWPDFDCVFFASSSAVSAFIEQCGSDLLAEKTVLVIGRPTARELERHGVQANVVADEATVAGAVRALAVFYVQRDMER